MPDSKGEESYTRRVAMAVIYGFEIDGKPNQADGVRVVLNHLNDMGFDEGLNEERETIFLHLIQAMLKDGRTEQAEGAGLFRQALALPVKF